MDRNRALNLLSLARKGGNIQLGEENVGAASRAGQARLIVVASDAADNTYGRVKTFSHAGKTTFIRVPYTKEELGHACGRAVCAMAAITDVALARAFVNALGQPEKYAELLADLDRRVERVQQRRREERPIATISNTGKSNSEVAI